MPSPLTVALATLTPDAVAAALEAGLAADVLEELLELELLPQPASAASASDDAITTPLRGNLLDANLGCIATPFSGSSARTVREGDIVDLRAREWSQQQVQEGAWIAADARRTRGGRRRDRGKGVFDVAD